MPSTVEITQTTPQVDTQYTVPSGTWYMVSCRLMGGGGGGGAGDDINGVGGGGGGESGETSNNACSVLLNGGDTILYTVGTGGEGAPDVSTTAGSDGTGSALAIYSGAYVPMAVPLIQFTTGYGVGGLSASGGAPGEGGAGANGGQDGSAGGYDGSGGAGGDNSDPGAAGGAGGSSTSVAGAAGANGRVKFVLVDANILGNDVNDYVALAATTCVVNSSVLRGDVGSLTGTTLNSSSVETPGVLHPDNDTTTQTAVTDAETARTFLLGSDVYAFTDYTGQSLGGLVPTLSPGIYSWSGSANITGTFTLNGAGLYVFQAFNSPPSTSGTWTSLANANIICSNGARPENVYFVSEGDVTINPTPSLSQNFGNYIAGGNITVIGPINNIFSRFLAPDGSVTIGQIGNLGLPTSWCYAKGTLILTTRGYVAIEDIQISDKVVTKGTIDSEGNVQNTEESSRQVTYVGKFTMSVLGKHSYPVCFKQGSIGENIPFQDLIVSPNHAILIHGRKTSAEWFVNNDTVYKMSDLQTMEYYVIELEEHSVIVANGVLSESMLGDRNAFETVRKNETLIEYLLPVA